MNPVVYDTPMLKKLAVVLVLAAALGMPKLALADDEVVICPQPYGGGVVCGVKTHVPVNTGIGDSLPMIGSGLLGASGVFAYFSRKLRKAE